MHFIVIAVCSTRGNEDCVVVYGNLHSLRQCCSHYCIPEFETAAGMMQDESVFSTPFCVFKLELKASLCNLNYPQIDSIVVSYRFLIFSAHVIVFVTLLFH